MSYRYQYPAGTPARYSRQTLGMGGFPGSSARGTVPVRPFYDREEYLARLASGTLDVPRVGNPWADGGKFAAKRPSPFYPGCPQPPASSAPSEAVQSVSESTGGPVTGSAKTAKEVEDDCETIGSTDTVGDWESLARLAGWSLYPASEGQHLLLQRGVCPPSGSPEGKLAIRSIIRLITLSTGYSALEIRDGANVVHDQLLVDSI